MEGKSIYVETGVIYTGFLFIPTDLLIQLIFSLRT
jgi:hypothetical protein